MSRRGCRMSRRGYRMRRRGCRMSRRSYRMSRRGCRISRQVTGCAEDEQKRL